MQTIYRKSVNTIFINQNTREREKERERERERERLVVVVCAYVFKMNLIFGYVLIIFTSDNIYFAK